MELYAIAMGSALVFAVGMGFLLLGDYLKSEKSKAKKAGKRVEQRAMFSQIAATEAGGKARAPSDRKAGFGRR